MGSGLAKLEVPCTIPTTRAYGGQHPCLDLRFQALAYIFSYQISLATSRWIACGFCALPCGYGRPPRPRTAKLIHSASRMIPEHSRMLKVVRQASGVRL